jgi:hypothetical protein
MQRTPKQAFTSVPPKGQDARPQIAGDNDHAAAAEKSQAADARVCGNFSGHHAFACRVATIVILSAAKNLGGKRRDPDSSLRSE